MICSHCGCEHSGKCGAAYFHEISEEREQGDLHAQLAEARAERDDRAREVELLRAVVSAHLHDGNGGQDLANAYAALRRFDKNRMDAARKGGGA